MGGEIKGLRTVGQGKAVADQAFQIHFTIHNEADRVGLQVNGRTIGTYQSFFIDTDGCGIDQGLSMLRLRKQQNPTPGTGSIHRGANQGVAANSENDRVGAASLSKFTDALDYVCPRSID